MSDKSREEFEKWYNLYFNYLHKLNESKINLTIRENVAFEAWQEQQKKIDELEAELHTIRAIITEKG